MKANLVVALDAILASLEKNEIQTIDVRGAIAFGLQFKSALSVVEEANLVEIIEVVIPEVKPAVPVTPEAPVTPVKEVVKEVVIQKA
jgi:hypothetical protein